MRLPILYTFMQLDVPIAVRTAVMIDARICSVHLIVSFLVIALIIKVRNEPPPNPHDGRGPFPISRLVAEPPFWFSMVVKNVPRPSIFSFF